MILESFLLFLFCLNLDYYLRNFFSRKNARNLVAAFHAYFSVIFHTLYFININFDFSKYLSDFAFSLSIGYFLFDIYYIIKYDKLDILRYMFIYHHFASIYLLFNNTLIDNTNQLILVAEISNLPSYPIYHLLHLQNRDDKINTYINLLKLIQKIIYFFIRIILMSNLLVNQIIQLDFNNSQNFYLAIISIPVYFMGIIWTVLLLFG